MALTEFNFKSSYNKIDHNIAEDFYLPCMRNAVNTIALQATLGGIYPIAWGALKEF